MSNIDKFDLLSNIISLINAEEYKSTIENMAKDCNVPLPYMRKTMITLLGNQIIQSCINSTDDYDNINDSSFLEDFLDDPEAISAQILDGIFDSTEWEINLKILDTNAEEILPLSHLEYGAIRSLGESELSIKRGSIYEKKETVNPISPLVRKNLETIQDAIARKLAVSFSYKKQNNETKQLVLFPQSIITNVSDNWIYLQSTEGKLYRLDRFMQSCRIINNAGPYPDTIEDPMQKYVWGAYFNKEMSRVHVKLRIAIETSNIIRKIENDISLRVENGTGKFYQDGDFYFYEDDVIGLDEFQRWVRGYGSSVLVLEPRSLQDTIVSRANETLNNYKLAENWNIV